jgi:uncharacterized repeat protein (TIGR04138 family)
MNPEEFKKTIKEIIKKDRRYAEDAYYFVNEAVVFASEYFSKPDFGQSRHLSGPELLDGMREFTLSEFGPMSAAVLRCWGINATLDFGQIVFNLIDASVLAASPSDKLGDFDEVYDFTDAFDTPFNPENLGCQPLTKIDVSSND